MWITQHSNPILPKFSGRFQDSSSDEDSGNETDTSCRKLIRHMENSPLNANRFPHLSTITSLLHTPDVFEKIQADDKPKARRKLAHLVEQTADSDSQYRSEPLNRETRQYIKNAWKIAKQSNPQGYKPLLYDRFLISPKGFEETEAAQQRAKTPLTDEQRQALELKPSVRQALNEETRHPAEQDQTNTQDTLPTLPPRPTDAFYKDMVTYLETNIPLNTNKFPLLSTMAALLHTRPVLENLQAANPQKARARFAKYVEELSHGSPQYQSKPLTPATKKLLQSLVTQARQESPQATKLALYDSIIHSAEWTQETHKAGQRVYRPLTQQHWQALRLKETP